MVKETSGSGRQRGVRERGRVKDLDGLSVSELKGYWYLTVKKGVYMEEWPNIGSKSLNNYIQDNLSFSLPEKGNYRKEKTKLSQVVSKWNWR